LSSFDISGGPSSEKASPLVSVVTPVFNGAKYLRDCIESVVAQSYENWEYTIVDNCSTDASLVIAQEYAERHPQIKVMSYNEFVGVIENHNRAFRSISRDAKYCKLVCADDWIYPECISKLVDLAERHPSVGIVGSYSASASGIRWSGMPLGEEVIAGRDAARMVLLGQIDSVWSSFLYPASMVRATDAFFPGSATSADLEACLNCLRHSDLGFVHQILSFERIHDEMITAKIMAMNSLVLDRVRILLEFGAEFLSPSERERQLEEQLSGYYTMLAVECLHFRDREFWRLHRERLDELGYSIYDSRLARALVVRTLDLTLNPKATTEKIIRRVKSRGRGVRRG
jgi:glycosyltransferase involved in cell wall biosynthesis